MFYFVLSVLALAPPLLLAYSRGLLVYTFAAATAQPTQSGPVPGSTADEVRDRAPRASKDPGQRKKGEAEQKLGEK